MAKTAAALPCPQEHCLLGAVWQPAQHGSRAVQGTQASLSYLLRCRQQSALSVDSARNEDTLNTYLFQLVKAGRVCEACSTCMEAGQPWRAASLQGGGMFGPIPLGIVLHDELELSLLWQIHPVSMMS